MASIKKITVFKTGRKVFEDIHYTVYYETGRKVNYYGSDTLPMTIVNFLTDENTISETVYIEDGYNHCINSRTTYKPQEKPTEDTETTEEQTTEAKKPTTEAKAFPFEIRQIEAWKYDGDWTFNDTWHMGEMTTKAQNIKRAFTAWLKRHLGISFKNNRTLIEHDGDCYTIIDRKTKEPLFIAIPNC